MPSGLSTPRTPYIQLGSEEIPALGVGGPPIIAHCIEAQVFLPDLHPPPTMGAGPGGLLYPGQLELLNCREPKVRPEPPPADLTMRIGHGLGLQLWVVSSARHVHRLCHPLTLSPFWATDHRLRCLHWRSQVKKLGHKVSYEAQIWCCRSLLRRKKSAFCSLFSHWTSSRMPQGSGYPAVWRGVEPGTLMSQMVLIRVQIMMRRKK